MNGWGTHKAADSGGLAAVGLSRGAGIAQDSDAGEHAVAAHGFVATAAAGALVGAAAWGQDVVDSLGGWDGRGRHGKGQDGEEVGELHFGVGVALGS